MSEPEIPKEVLEIAKKLGATLTAIDLRQGRDMLTSLLAEVESLKQQRLVAMQTCGILLHRLGGSATLTREDLESVEEYTLESRTDTATDSVYLYLKPGA